MTAFHIIMLSGLGLPLIPTGGSDARRLKSRMRRRLALVDWGQVRSTRVRQARVSSPRG